MPRRFHPDVSRGADMAARAKAHEAKLLKVYGCDIEAFLVTCRESITMTTGGPGFIAISLLSDVQELIEMGDAEGARQMINRVKRLLADDVVAPYHAARQPKE